MATYREACKCPPERQPDKNKRTDKKNSSNNRTTKKGANGGRGNKGKEDTKKGQERPKKEQHKYPCITGLCGRKGAKGKSTKK
jgi:hypothetical protein